MNQEPIELLGGENLYQFAPNASGWIDPLGLVIVDAKFKASFWGSNPTGREHRASGDMGKDFPIRKGGKASKNFKHAQMRTEMEKCHYHLWLGKYETEEGFEKYFCNENGVSKFLEELGYSTQEAELFEENGKMEGAFPYLKAIFPIHELLKFSPVKKGDLEIIMRYMQEFNITEPNTYIGLVDDSLSIEFGKKFDNYHYLGCFEMDGEYLDKLKFEYPETFAADS